MKWFYVLVGVAAVIALLAGSVAMAALTLAYGTWIMVGTLLIDREGDKDD